jgi:hypothetical protein
MAEGRTSATYATDGHVNEPAAFNVRVPNNLYAEASLGWTAKTAGAPTMPGNFHPRHVEGLGTTGKRVRAICATAAATLWTGAATTWTYIDNFGTTITATVTGYIGEKYST